MKNILITGTTDGIGLDTAKVSEVVGAIETVLMNFKKHPYEY